MPGLDQHIGSVFDLDRDIPWFCSGSHSSTYPVTSSWPLIPMNPAIVHIFLYYFGENQSSHKDSAVQPAHLGPFQSLGREE